MKIHTGCALILLLLLCFIYGCAESARQPAQARPVILDATPRNYAAPYMAPTPFEVPTHCNNLPTQQMTWLCEFAKNNGITMQQADGVLTLAGMEATANLCGFTITENFKAVRNDVLMQTINGKGIYDNLVSTWKPDGIYDIPVWCKQRYVELGRSSQLRYYK